MVIRQREPYFGTVRVISHFETIWLQSLWETRHGCFDTNNNTGVCASVVTPHQNALRIAAETENPKLFAEFIGETLVESLAETYCVFGADPNPGRILQAAGDAAVDVDPGVFGASIGGVPVIDHGVVVPATNAKEALEGPEVLIGIDLGIGTASATVFGCDLSYDYVRINAEYST